MSMFVACQSGAASSRVRKSIDDGATFSQLGTLDGTIPQGIYVAENEEVLIGCTTEDIERSENSGVSFSQVYDTPLYGNGLDVCSSPDDEDRIWFCGRTMKIYYTTDQGDNWSEVDLPGSWTSSNYARGIHFVSNLIGWCVGEEYIFKTTDGGATWVNQHTFPSDMYDVFALDENTVWALEGVSTGKIWKSTNGGTDWTGYATLRQYAGGRIYASGNNVWFTGRSTVTIECNYSSNAGADWNRSIMTDDYSGPTNQVPIIFVSSLIGYTFMYHVYKTTDGGQTWVEGGVCAQSTSYLAYHAWINPALSTQARNFSISTTEPTDRTTDGTIIDDENPLNFGQTPKTVDSGVKCIIFRVVSFGVYATVSNMRFYISDKTDFTDAASAFYADITNTWTQNKSAAQVKAGTPGTCPTAEPAANLTKIDGGNITGSGHDDTSQYIYLLITPGGDEAVETKNLTYRVRFDYA